MTNTTFYELAVDCKYLIVDKLVSYVTVLGKRRILSCESVNSKLTTPVGSTRMTPSLSKMQ